LHIAVYPNLFEGAFFLHCECCQLFLRPFFPPFVLASSGFTGGRSNGPTLLLTAWFNVTQHSSRNSKPPVFSALLPPPISFSNLFAVVPCETHQPPPPHASPCQSTAPTFFLPPTAPPPFMTVCKKTDTFVSERLSCYGTHFAAVFSAVFP